LAAAAWAEASEAQTNKLHTKVFFIPIPRIRQQHPSNNQNPLDFVAFADTAEVVVF
jgi:hypothetical protein